MMIVTTNPKEIKSIMGTKSDSFFLPKAGASYFLRKGLIMLEGDEWKRHRKLLSVRILPLQMHCH